jgi:hypothetical protein
MIVSPMPDQSLAARPGGASGRIIPRRLWVQVSAGVPHPAYIEKER